VLTGEPKGLINRLFQGGPAEGTSQGSKMGCYKGHQANSQKCCLEKLQGKTIQDSGKKKIKIGYPTKKTPYGGGDTYWGGFPIRKQRKKPRRGVWLVEGQDIGPRKESRPLRFPVARYEKKN